MANRLKNTLAYSIAAGASSVIPHLLNINGIGQTPDAIFVPSADLVVTADATNVTLTNTGAGLLAGSVLVEYWHSYEREFGAVQTKNLPTKPYIVVGSGSGTGVIPPSNVFVFNPYGVSGGNLYTDFPAVVAAMQEVQGYKQLQFDNTRHGAGTALSIPVAGTVRLTTPATATPFQAGMVGQNIYIQGSATAANNGGFPVSAFIDAHTIEYTNAGGVAEAVFAGVWVVIGSGGSVAVIIPAGTYDMTMVEWIGYHNPLATAGVGGIPVSLPDGVYAFENLRKIDGDIIITSLINAPNPAPLTLRNSGIIELGQGFAGDFPQIICNGTQAFFDGSGIPGGQVMTIRINGVVGGTASAIQMGAGSGILILSLFDAARVAVGMVAGSNAAAVAQVLTSGSGAYIGQQASTYAGILTMPSNPNLRTTMLPAPTAGGVITAPSTVAFTAGTGLAVNGTFRYDTTAGDIAQTMPPIKIAVPVIGSTSTSNGSMKAEGMFFIAKNQTGANNVNLSPAAGETIEGGAGPLAVPAGGARILMPDGVSNWIVVGGYL